MSAMVACCAGRNRSPQKPSSGADSVMCQVARAKPSCSIAAAASTKLQQHRAAAADVIGEVATDGAGGERAGAVERDDQAGVRDGEVARLRQVEREERVDEAAEAVDERARPQVPERPRQAAHAQPRSNITRALRNRYCDKIKT